MQKQTFYEAAVRRVFRRKESVDLTVRGIKKATQILSRTLINFMNA